MAERSQASIGCTLSIAAACGRNQPPERICRCTVARPALSGDCKRLLAGLLGKVEIAGKANQTREHATPLLAERLFDQAGSSTSGRTSTEPPIRRAGTRSAIASAASRSPASNR